ncbi:MAG: cobalamin-binding protein [Betaproteobacteria bacterium]
MLKILIALSLLASFATVQAEVVVQDDVGNTIRLAQPAKRIITLAPHMAETLFAAGAGSRLVGVVEYSDFPEEVKKITRVGGYSRFDLEAVLALKPDLVIAWYSGNAPAHLEKLRSLGLPVYISQPNSIEDVASELERFGLLAGTGEIAKAEAAKLRERHAALKKRYSQRPVVRTFYQVWKQPLTTIGGKQIITSIIRLCGGENVFAKLDAFAPVVTVEAVISANPEAIIASGMEQSRPEWLDDWKRWTSINAVSRDNLFFIQPQLIQRHTPRLLDGAELLCQHLETVRARKARG